MNFSQRIGIVESFKAIQKDAMDDDLRNGLWNLLQSLILDRIEDEVYHPEHIKPIEIFRLSLWHHYFKKPLDEAPTYKPDIFHQIRRYFFKAGWYQVYDILEFILNEIRKPFYNLQLSEIEKIFNHVLEREFSAYRIMEGAFVPITNDTEIESIEIAEKNTNQLTLLKGSNIHLKASIKFLSDRENPNYRNSIKESISALESVVKVIGNNQKDSLGSAIDKIKGKVKIHPSLEKGFKNIYGYTSDADGIRHALMEEPDCDFEDAKYMLVSCSAFINYLLIKANKAGIGLK